MARRSFLRRTSLVLAGLLVITLANAQTPDGRRPPSWRPEQEKKAAAVREQLDKPVKFPGIDDPEMKLCDLLCLLERSYDIPFTVNERAFKHEHVDDVLNKPIGKPIPKFNNVALSTVLRKVLERIPSVTGVTWFARGGEVEITTVSAYQAEFYPTRPDGPFPPIVSTNFEKKPLEEALKKLAEDTYANIVLDVRAGDKAKTLVTARLITVPLDTVILLLADMADLEPVELDGVY